MPGRKPAEWPAAGAPPPLAASMEGTHAAPQVAAGGADAPRRGGSAADEEEVAEVAGAETGGADERLLAEVLPGADEEAADVAARATDGVAAPRGVSAGGRSLIGSMR
mmetsp:Transcript_45496/g.119534  ORF Transcript_45496/g.119534 Transcript_45496/m.119534 type:complete len:108 (+) Transcript_45496:194-517(+)